MISLLHYLQKTLRPDLNDRPRPTRYLLMSNVVGVIYGLPILVLGLISLLFKTQWSLLFLQWPSIVVILISVIIFSRLRFFMMYTLQGGHMVGSDGDFIGMILWASIFIFGYSILWVFLLWTFAELVLACRRSVNQDMRWESFRSAILNADALIIPSLLSLGIYRNLGGSIPIAGMSIQSLLPAIVTVFSFAIFYLLIWLPLILYVVWVQDSKFKLNNAKGLFWFTVVTMMAPFISLPFGVLASGIFVEHGGIVLGIYLIGLLSIALLANQLSRSAAKSRRQATQLMGLERLGRDIIASAADARNLPALLRKHIPDMFPCRRAAVWLAPETYLLKYPDGKDKYSPAIWDWLLEQTQPQGFLENAPLPWDSHVGFSDHHFALLTAPILDPVSGETIGGLFVELLSLPQKWDKTSLDEHNPALKNLAAQIASALQQADNYRESLKHQRVTQELRLAGDIQASFLPDRPPDIPGWDIAASLTPARQTSGDFYDFFRLDNDRLGVIIADVADKGLGAALYMALGRTLLLTYAHEYPENPAAVLHATNQRMLSDARAQMFITAFYGVLELGNGRLIYSNAGHQPAILIRNNENHKLQHLGTNGMALGIDKNAAWVAISQQINVDDTLLLYTDGVVEANNLAGEFYGTHKLIEKVEEVANRPSQWVIRAIQENVLDFQEGASQSDDITLMCIRRRA